MGQGEPETRRAVAARVWTRRRASGLFSPVQTALSQGHAAGTPFGYGIALGSHVRGATPSEYLDRLDLQNQIFNDDIRLERVVLKSGKPVIVTSQPAIKGNHPTQAALDELMLAKGYEQLAEGAYYDARAGLLVFDLFPRNAIQAADGQVYPFDPVIQRVSPDFADFLRQEPYTINLVN